MIKKPALNDVRTKGQVWTPRWVADGMAKLLLADLATEVSILDPALGPGVLLAACRDMMPTKIKAYAFEIDNSVLSEAHGSTSFDSRELEKLEISNFLDNESTQKYDLIISNPPYLRHHKIPSDEKEKYAALARETLNVKIDGRAGLHVYFLIKALEMLGENGKLVFILPADTFEGIFSQALWTAVTSRYHVQYVVSFKEEVAAFPGVDTNAVIIRISNTKSNQKTCFAEWAGRDPDNFGSAIRSLFNGLNGPSEDLGLNVFEAETMEAVKRGFTRSQNIPLTAGIKLAEFAKIVRGIATGANDFFLFDSERIKNIPIDSNFFVRTVARVRDVPGPELRDIDLDRLDEDGRPTYLLSMRGDEPLSGVIKEYLDFGIKTGVSEGSLVSARGIWYRMEQREPPPILFAYLGRRNIRFIRNFTSARPLTGFLCVYALNQVDPDVLCAALNDERTINELKRVGKSYGGGALKVEPGGLRNLIIPNDVVDEFGLRSFTQSK